MMSSPAATAGSGAILRTRREEILADMQNFAAALANDLPGRNIHLSYSELSPEHYTVSLSITANLGG